MSATQKDIDIVENSLTSLIKSEEHNKKMLDIATAQWQEKQLRDYLVNIPEAMFETDECKSQAFVDGIVFYFLKDEYGWHQYAKYKQLYRFLKWGWVRTVDRPASYMYGQKLKWILEKHLEALLFESKKNKEL